MTAIELIEILRTYPPDTRVMVSGYENGYDDLEPDRVTIMEVHLDTGKWWWDGRHSDVRDGRKDGGGSAFPLVLQRPKRSSY